MNSLPSSVKPREKAPGPANGQALRVLIVEDTDSDAQLVLRALRRGGYEPSYERVESAAAMQAALARQAWDLVLSDYVMPGFGGLEALDIAKSSGLDVPFILVSNKVSEEILVEAMRAGAMDFVMKDRLARLGPVVKRELADAAARAGAAHARLEWRAVLDSVQDAIFVHDAEFRIVRANLTYVALGQMPIQDAIGKRYWEVFPRMAGPLPGCKGVHVGEAAKAEEEVRLDTGEVYLSRSFPILSAAGYDGHFLHVLQDVTERNRVRDAIETSEKRYRALMEHASDIVFVIDFQGRIAYASPSVNQLLVYAADELQGRQLGQFIHPGDGAALEGGLAETTVNHLAVHTVDIRFRRKDGRWIVLECAARNALGNPLVNGLVINARDVTRRKEEQEALRAAEQQFRGLVEQSIAGIYIIQDRKFAYVNPRFAEIRGFGSADEVIGLDPLALVAEKDRAAIAEHNRRVFAGEAKTYSHSFTALRKDGSTVEVGVQGTISNFHGRPAIIGMLQDISEKKRAEEEIQRYVAKLQIAFMSSVEVATNISEMRDPYTAGHERRVAKIAVAIGAELGFDASRQEGLQVAGQLHDIGKITVPAEILSKPGKLSAAEFEIIQGHAQAGYDILKRVEFPWPVAQVALQHHERMDGSGYPQGLKGDAILLEARVLAVADVVEAMASYRPYRPGLGIDKALAEIERGRGTIYDVAVADACLRLFRDKGYRLPE